MMGQLSPSSLAKLFRRELKTAKRYWSHRTEKKQAGGFLATSILRWVRRGPVSGAGAPRSVG